MTGLPIRDTVFHLAVGHYRATSVNGAQLAQLGDTEQSDPHAVRFRAFVSYSHADAAVAQKLHRKIEAYRLPQHLRGRYTADPDKGRLGRIFRDREDLPAAEDLSESVKRALAGSQVLVVICSPDARASVWVAKEIDLFRALHPDRPVLAALVRGEPDEAFPRPLLDGAEPLAADLRKQGDGWRLGFLKIVAGIADVPLDALVQRDATRRIRRVMAVTGGALVALLAMTGMTIFAVQSRNEAQHQQAQAEGLVDYMITDLRNEMISVGRLDVMSDVNRHAFDYYKDQIESGEMSDQSMDRFARVIGAMGQDDAGIGKMSSASAKFARSYRLTRALLDKRPDDDRRRLSHADSVNRLALTAYSDNEPEKAFQRLVEASELLKPIGPPVSRSPEYLRLAALVNGNLCAVHVERRDVDGPAMELCRESVRLSNQLTALQPDNLQAEYERIFHSIWLSNALITIGEADVGNALLLKSVARSEALVRRDPENTRWQEQQVEIYLRHIRFLNSNGQKPGAREYLARAETIIKRLNIIDPSNKMWRDFLKKLTRIKQEVTENG